MYEVVLDNTMNLRSKFEVAQLDGFNVLGWTPFLGETEAAAFPRRWHRSRWDEKAQEHIDGHTESATLSSDHFEDPDVQWASQVASRVEEDSNSEPLSTEGNFGRPHAVDTDRGKFIVKFPQSHTIHGDPWRPSEIRNWLIHEGAVLEALRGVTSIVPWGVYTETSRGTPAVVREYGSLAWGTVTMAEYKAIEDGLMAVWNYGWEPKDDPLPARRANGSIFIADVGFWQAPNEPPATPGWERDRDSDVGFLLERLIGGRDRSGAGPDLHLVGRAHLFNLNRQAESTRGWLHPDPPAPRAKPMTPEDLRKYQDWHDAELVHVVPRLERHITVRDHLGLTVPDSARSILAEAKEHLTHVDKGRLDLESTFEGA